MNCPMCNAPMIIDEWDGWVWKCFECDHTGREATDGEITDQHDWVNEQMDNEKAAKEK